MADMSIFSVEPPRWLQEIAKPIDTKLTGQVLAKALLGATGASARGRELVTTGYDAETVKAYQEPRGGSWFQNFLGAASEAGMSMQDPFWRLKADQLKLKTAEDVLGLVREGQAMQLARTNMANEAHDLDLAPNWFSLTPEERLHGRQPGFRSALWSGRAIAQDNADRQWMRDQTNTNIGRNYDSRRTALSKRGDVGLTAATNVPATNNPGPQDFAILETKELEVAAYERTEREKREAAAATLGPPRSVTITGPGGATVYGGATTGAGSPAAQYNDARKFLLAQGPLGGLWAGRLPYLITTPTQADMAQLATVMAGYNQEAEAQVRESVATGRAGGGPVTSTVRISPWMTETTTTTPEWTAAVPQPSVEPTSGTIFWPVPVFKNGRVVNYDMQRINSHSDKLITANQLADVAAKLNDSLITSRFTMTPAARDEAARQRDAYQDMANQLINSQLPDLRALVERRQRGGAAPAPVPPARGTNAPPLRGTNVPTSGSRTNWILDASGNLVPAR